MSFLNSIDPAFVFGFGIACVLALITAGVCYAQERGDFDCLADARAWRARMAQGDRDARMSADHARALALQGTVRELAAREVANRIAEIEAAHFARLAALPQGEMRPARKPQGAMRPARGPNGRFISRAAGLDCATATAH